MFQVELCTAEEFFNTHCTVVKRLWMIWNIVLDNENVMFYVTSLWSDWPLIPVPGLSGQYYVEDLLCTG